MGSLACLNRKDMSLAHMGNAASQLNVCVFGKWIYF